MDAGGKGDARAVAVARAMARDPDAGVRQAALDALRSTGEQGDGEVMACMAGLAKDPEVSIRRAAIENLAEMVPDPAVDTGAIFRAALPTLSLALEAAAKASKGRAGEGGALRVLHFEWEQALALAGTPDARQTAQLSFPLARADGFGRVAAEEIAAAVQAGAESQRLPAGVMATLAEALLDSSSVVRAAAGKAVLRAAGRGSAQGLEALAALLLASRASFTDELVHALHALAGARGHARVVEALCFAADDPRTASRILALETLGRLAGPGDDHACAILREAAESGETIEVRARANKALAGLVAAGAGARAPAEGGSGRAAPRREDYTLLMMREDVAVRRRAVQLAARAPPGGAGLLRLQEALARRMKQDADLQVRRVAAASLAEVSPPPDAPVQQAMLEAALHEADRDTCAALLVLLAARAAPGDRLVTASLVHLLGAPAWQGAAGAPVRRRAAEGIARVVDPADAALGEALGLSALLLARARMPDEVVSVRRACHETHLRLRLHKPKTAQGEDSDDD